MDYMANFDIKATEKKTFRSFEQLPSMERKIINIEKAQMPSLRVCSNKIIQQYV